MEALINGRYIFLGGRATKYVVVREKRSTAGATYQNHAEKIERLGLFKMGFYCHKSIFRANDRIPFSSLLCVAFISIATTIRDGSCKRDFQLILNC